MALVPLLSPVAANELRRPAPPTRRAGSVSRPTRRGRL